MNPDGMATDSTAGPETLKSFLQLHLKYVIESIYKTIRSIRLISGYISLKDTELTSDMS